jgi:hypothetical protein
MIQRLMMNIILKLKILLVNSSFLSHEKIFIYSFQGYQTAYSQLAYAARPEPDPFNGEIPNSKIFLAKKLEIASKGLASRLRVLKRFIY